jgi:L-threonylcarbamoyladenylate synthase
MSVVLPAADPATTLSAARLLRDGGVVVIPTDTVYGLAASVYQQAPVERIYAIKQRPPERQVPVLLATAADLPLLVEEVPRAAWALIARYWPGPLTLVLPARTSLPRWIRGEGRTIGCRVPASRTCLQILQVVGEPLVGTSANVVGASPALTASEALDQMGGMVDAVVDDDRLLDGTVSTVVELTETRAIVHRAGAVSTSALRQVLGVRVDTSP